jgi:hypothetical protein
LVHHFEVRALRGREFFKCQPTIAIPIRPPKHLCGMLRKIGLVDCHKLIGCHLFCTMRRCGKPRAQHIVKLGMRYLAIMIGVEFSEQPIGRPAVMQQALHRSIRRRRTVNLGEGDACYGEQ